MINPQIEESVQRITNTLTTIAALMVELREEDRERQAKVNEDVDKRLSALEYGFARIHEKLK
jgi:two-component sensor histidine kinase